MTLVLVSFFMLRTTSTVGERPKVVKIAVLGSSSGDSTIQSIPWNV